MYLHRISLLFSFTSLPKKQPMTKTTLVIFFFSLFLFYTPICVGGISSSLGDQRSLKVSHDEFVSSLKLVDNHLQDVSANLLQLQSNNVQNSDHPRLPSAISTCLQLLKLSTEELIWCLTALKSPKGKYGTGNLVSDMSTWLGAILANIDTCFDGFEEAGEKMKGDISIALEEANSLISDMLNQMKTVAVDDFTTHHGQLPSWVKPSDKELLLTKDAPFDVVVAADGTGNYTKIMDAVNSVPESSNNKRFVIYIKKGTYNEKVLIDVKKNNLTMVGDGQDATIISGDSSFSKNYTTYESATFAILGRGFMAKDISFRNTAGPSGYQAVALRSNSDCSVFYKCGFFGYQDTLYVHSGRQFYKECKIRGTVDFIFGYGAAVFQNCLVLVKKGLVNQTTNTITAQGRMRTVPNGFSFQFCNITADSDLLPFINSTKTFLGRPWKEYATAVFMESYLSNVVSPQGWCEWNGTTVYLDTLFFAEYRNYGLGAQVKNRVKWKNYHVLTDPRQANKFTVAKLISGDHWLTLTGVPYTPGLGDQNITIGN